jgi:SPP1 gp7 family putative phage head morphogenesis protein
LYYRSNCCDVEHPVVQLSKQEEDNLSRLIESYFRQLFDDRNVSEENKQALWEYYNSNLSKAFDIGYNENSTFYDKDLAKALKKDIAKFSAFKETSFRSQLEALLTEDGKVVPWSEFKKKAFELHVEYNERWLKSEYHHTVATANSVDNWKRFEADSDLYPNLKYNAVNDKRTRDAHRALDGIILPINHVFWKTHNVPLDWGCRCSLEQTDEEPSKTVPKLDIKAPFKNNAALSGEIFGEMPYATAMNKEQIKEANANATKFGAA